MAIQGTSAKEINKIIKNAVQEALQRAADKGQLDPFKDLKEIIYENIDIKSDKSGNNIYFYAHINKGRNQVNQSLQEFLEKLRVQYGIHRDKVIFKTSGKIIKETLLAFTSKGITLAHYYEWCFFKNLKSLLTEKFNAEGASGTIKFKTDPGFEKYQLYMGAGKIQAETTAAEAAQDFITTQGIEAFQGKVITGVGGTNVTGDILISEGTNITLSVELKFHEVKEAKFYSPSERTIKLTEFSNRKGSVLLFYIFCGKKEPQDLTNEIISNGFANWAAKIDTNNLFTYLLHKSNQVQTPKVMVVGKFGVNSKIREVAITDLDNAASRNSFITTKKGFQDFRGDKYAAITFLNNENELGFFGVSTKSVTETAEKIRNKNKNINIAYRSSKEANHINLDFIIKPAFYLTGAYQIFH